MIGRWFKMGIVGAVGLCLVGGLLLGSDLISYVSTSARSVSSAVKDSVPIEFELRRARDLLEEIIPEMHANIRLIAQEEVEIAGLKSDIKESDRTLAEEEKRVQKLAGLLTTTQDKYVLGDRRYSRQQVKEDLARRFDLLKEAEVVKIPVAEPVPASDQPLEDIGEPPQPPEADAAAQLTPYDDMSRQSFYPVTQTNPVLSFLGGVVMFIAVLIGLTWALGLPQAVAAGLPDASLARELERDVFGTPTWPNLVRQIAQAASIITMLFAAIFLIVARGRAGAAHMIRAALGTAGLLAALHMLGEALGRIDWQLIATKANDPKAGPGAAIETFLNGARSNMAAAAGCAVLASIFILAWPEKRPVSQLPVENGQGV